MSTYVVYVKWVIIDLDDDWWYITEVKAENQDEAGKKAVAEAIDQNGLDEDHNIWPEEIYGPYIKKSPGEA